MEPSNRSASWVTSSAKLARGGGSATIVGLEAIRKEAGDRWSKLRDNVFAKLDLLLRQYLGPSDFFLSLDEMNRLVIMPDVSPEHGQVTCLRIAYDLHKSLFGSCGLDQLNVAPAVAVRDDILEVEAFDRAKLLELVQKAELTLAPGAAGRLDTGSGDGDVEIGFVPVWDSEFQVIRAYRCVALEDHRHYGPENAALWIRETTQLTLTLLERGVDELETLLTHGKRVVLNVPISYEVVSNPVSRMKLLAECRELDAELRPYMAYTITDLPVGVPQSRVAEVVTMLKAFCGAVMARAPARAGQTLASFRSAGIRALGLSLKTVAPSDYDTEVAVLMSEAKRSKFKAFVDHVDTPETLRCVLNRGVTWMSGEAVAPAVAVPGPLKSLPRKHLLCPAA